MRGQVLRKNLIHSALIQLTSGRLLVVLTFTHVDFAFFVPVFKKAAGKICGGVVLKSYLFIIA